MTLQSLADIVLNGEEYQIDMGSYRVRDIVDFAPRASEPGGSIIHSELGLYQPFLQTDFRHGFGFQWFTDAEGYSRTDGNIDTRHAGIAMLMTAEVNDSATFLVEGYTVARSLMSPNDTTQSTDYLIAWGTTEDALGGLHYRTTDGTWSTGVGAGADTTAEFNAVNFVLETQNYVHVCPNDARLVTITKSDGTMAAGGVNANATDYKWMIAHEGYIYAGKDGTSLIFRDSNENLSQLAGDAADDPNVITMAGNFPTIGAIVAFGKLFVTRQDGLFQVGDDLIARRVLDFSGEIGSDNFRSISLFNNRLIFPVRDTLYSWNGATLADITPPFLTDTFPYMTYGRFDNLVAANGYLFLSARTNEGIHEEHILCWDGVGFHKLIDFGTLLAPNIITAMAYDSVNNYLWYAADSLVNTNTYVQFQDRSEFPYENFPTSGTNSLITSRLDMGFRRVRKSTPSIFIEADNVNSSDYIDLYYSIDGGSFTSWGGDSDTRKITSSGIVEMTGPVGAGTTIQYNQLQLRFDFVTSQSTGSPILEGYTLRFIMRPNTLYGHSFNVVAAEDLKVGAGSRALKSVRDIYSALETARASAAPITFVDPFGVSHSGYISALERRAIERHGRAEREGFPDIESVVQVNFVEVG